MRQDSAELWNKVPLKIQVRYLSIQVIIFLVLPLFLITFLFNRGNAEAVSVYCVRSGASGANNGADWDNAYSSLPSTLERGATYYVADGSYGAYTYDDSVSGSTYITIKKATIGDHGTSTGWVDSYGDGQAVFSAIQRFDSGYYIFDGNNVPPVYGFKVIQNSTYGVWMRNSSADYVTVSNIELDASSAGGETQGVTYESGANNCTLQYSYIHNIDGDGIAANGNSELVLQYNIIGPRIYPSPTGTHADAIQMFGSNSNWTLRYNKFDWNGQQVFWGGGSRNSLFYIYGNVFYGGTTAGQYLKGQSGNPPITNSFVYNNTFWDAGTSTINMGAGASNITIKNNIFYDTAPPSFPSGSHDYNWFYQAGSNNEAHGQMGTGDPFINKVVANFRLSTSTNAGDSSIGSTYGTDYYGNSRGEDGVWDRGAYEFSGSFVSRPSPPIALSIN